MKQGEFKIEALKKPEVQETKNEGADPKQTEGIKEVKPETLVKNEDNVEDTDVIQVIEENTGDNKNIQPSNIDTQNDGVLKDKVLQGHNETVLPENIQSLVSFINETGGTIQDYARLNYNVEDADEVSVLKEYYKSSKPHLEEEDVNFYIENKFVVDEDLDDETTSKLKGIAYKEEVAKAKKHITEKKEKYYKEIKSNRTQVDPEAQKAVDFFNRFKKDTSDREAREQQYKIDSNKFLEGKEGFDFDLGNKKVKYKYKDAKQVANQVDIKEFVRKFVGEDGQLDFNGYHKAMYVANNADKMMKSFYEQGKADMAKEMTSKSKNVTNVGNSVPKSEGFTNGLKFKVLKSGSGNDFKIKK